MFSTVSPGLSTFFCSTLRKSLELPADYFIQSLSRNEYERMSTVLKKHERGNKMLSCTACPNKSDAEMVHPHLRVPICGACSAALKDADLIMEDQNLQSCAWCGNADGANLFYCDTCPRSFCEECVERNFGPKISGDVKALKSWCCYVCVPTPELEKKQVQEGAKYMNLDRAYNSIRPPSVQEVSSQTATLFAKLTPEEKSFAGIFSGSVGHVTIQDSELIGQYLTAIDFSVVLRVSTGLRRYFHSEVNIIPGLFKTPYGAEHNCRLYNHQVVSLNRMTQIENASKEFGALRGGIFGDEPGLGKTVTTLALVASTAGVMPQQPSTFWDKNTIDEHWALQKGSFGKLLGPVLNTLQKSPAIGRYQLDRLHHIRVNVEQHCASVKAFESTVRKCIQEEIPRLEDRSKLLDIFRQEMTQIKEGLDRSQRKQRSTTANTPLLRRIKFERGLCPSSATLIVVPLALLEHWYEQIKRHLNLHYFTNDGEQRGVVYLDGLGDIVDVEAPLSKLKVDAHTTLESVQFLSHYMIVVTTFERCAVEYRMRQERGNTISASSEMSLLQMRWLRLVVDEGHEIGKSAANVAATRTARFISQIAAERRWVMSGTPTTGAKSDVALEQLYKLLQFLRHPRLINGGISGGGGGSVIKTEKGVVKSESGVVKIEKGVVKSESSESVNSTSSVGKRKAHTLDTDTTISTSSTTTVTTTITTTDTDFLSPEKWHKDVVVPCLAQKEEAWQSVVELLKTVLLRHTKNDIHLFEPVRVTVNLTLPLTPFERQNMTEDERDIANDQAKANYIADTMLRARAEYRAFVRSGGVSGTEARRRNILNRMNHNRLSVGGGGGGSSSGSSTNDAATKASPFKVLSLAELIAMKNKNNNTTSTTDTTTSTTSAIKKERVLTGVQSSIGSSLNCATASSSAVVPAVAENITTRLLEVTEADKELCSRVRVPKAIVFSLHHWHLQGVGHQLILRLGESSMCEHFGTYRSSELSRFRHSKKKFRQCPMCGYCNQITTGNSCGNMLLLVEYVNTTWLNAEEDGANNNNNMFPAEPAGHGRAGPGGHYTGKCLCSPQGCVPPADQANNPLWFCGHLPNPFHKAELVAPEHFNHSIVSYEHIDGYVPGKQFNIGDHVFVRRQNACPQGAATAQSTSSAALNDAPLHTMPPTNANLWTGGVYGGHAIVRGWRHCGGKASVPNWHGDKILQHVPWRVESEDATILLLEEDGSTGLDLSFATHIFLLDRIKDPALRNQIVSRAHRMGAQGPVRVELVQVASDDADVV